MKSILVTILTLVIFLSCSKKNNDNCKLTQTDDYVGNTVSGSTKFEYDAMGRITKLITLGTNSITELTYNSDSVVVQSGPTKQIYFLNSTGLADSSVMVLPPTPEQLKVYYKYTYNSEGYLITEKQILSQLYNGSTLLDTTTTTYTITNGNITKFSNTQSLTDVELEYSTELTPVNNHNLNFVSPQFSFLGKQSKNLVSKVKEGNNITNISYERDNRGNITSQTGLLQGNGQTSKRKYHYTCD